MLSGIFERDLLLLCFLAIGNSIWAKSIENRTEERAIEEENGTVTSTPIEFSSTGGPLVAATNILSITSPVSGKKPDGSEFRPSVHLGVIEEPGIRASLHNDLRPEKNPIESKSYREFYQRFKVVPPPTSQSPPKNNTAGDGYPYENIPAILKAEKRKENRVKFHDDSYPVESSGTEYKDLRKDDHSSVPSSLENSRTNYELLDQQQVFQNLEKPVYEYETGLFHGKPTKFQDEGQNFDLAGSSNFDTAGSQLYGLQQGYNYQPTVFQQYEVIRKPDDVVFVHQQESSFTRTRQYPYTLYQQQGPLSYQDLELMDNMHSLTPYFKRRRISPWKKLIHLIGAFLPLGLLLATLTPNVVKIDNTTQPNIVLSKLRVADLAAEHKQARILEDSTSVCEERSICELIAAGGKGSANVLQRILWNLATGTSEQTARENGLKTLFDSAKRKDCKSIIC